MPTSNPIPDETELITVHYLSCNCVKKRYRLKEKSTNYPEPTEIRLDGDCWRCEERKDREGAAAAAAARRRRAGLKGRLRGMVKGRKARMP